MGGYGAVEAAAIAVYGMYEGLDGGGMGWAQFRGKIFEKVADLVGGDHGDTEAENHPEEVSGSDFTPGEVENQGI